MHHHRPRRPPRGGDGRARLTNDQLLPDKDIGRIGRNAIQGADLIHGHAVRDGDAPQRLSLHHRMDEDPIGGGSAGDERLERQGSILCPGRGSSGSTSGRRDPGEGAIRFADVHDIMDLSIRGQCNPRADTPDG